MTIKASNYPTVRPSLDLNFAQTKRLDPRITFSRASSGTYFDSTGTLQSAATNQARFDHDPATGESLGLLVEEARTNLVKESVPTTFAYYWWSTIGGTDSPNATLAPDNTLTAAEFTYDGSSTDVRQYIPQVNNLSAGTTYVGSIFLKSINATTFSIGKTGASNISGTTGTFGAVFNLSAGTATSSGTDVWIEPHPNGWYKCSFAFVANLTNASAYIIIYPGAGRNFYFWGGQIEAGSFPTSYIPTPATFTSRSTTATYYDANGTIQTAGINVARDNAYFPDENGVFKPAGLLLEAAGTNFLTNSEHLDTGWLYQSSTISPTTTSVEAPDGGLDARLFAGAGDRVRQDTTPSTGAVVYTLSVYYKPNTDTTLRLLLFNNGSQADVTFDTTNPNNPTITTGSGFMVDTGNGWFRASVTTSAATDGGTIESMIYTDSGYLWGAQLEASPYPTSYIPTTTATVTRAADVSSSSTVTRSADVAQITGTNFSSWYNQSEGTVFAAAKMQYKPSQSGNYFPGIYSSGAYPNRLWELYLLNATNSLTIGSDTHTRNLQTLSTSPQMFKVAQALSNTSLTYSASKDGATVLTGGMSKAIINTSSIVIGPGAGAIKHISRLTYYPVRLPDATLQTITS